MSTAVITGASGFIGSALTNHLLSLGWAVTAVVRRAQSLSNLNHPKLKVVELDFERYRELSRLLGPHDYFFHLAWQDMASVGAVIPEIQLANVSAALRALRAASESGCGKFILTGSVSELQVVAPPLPEVPQPSVKSAYGTCKLTARLLSSALASQLGMPLNTAILANTFGPGDLSTRSSNTLIRAFIHHESPRLVKGEALNDWLYMWAFNSFCYK
ncbi:MAG: NAD(P)-dependent oxidoreductase [Succinivibrio sp.]|nr:NAD(P)-dependent oxidoreductase [Succinivibrio sp.]